MLASTTARAVGAPTQVSRPAGLAGRPLVTRPASKFVVRAQSEESTSPNDVNELFADLSERWSKVENKPSLIIFGVGSVGALYVASSLVSAIHNVPLLPKLMELVGLGYTAWFVYRYLLFKSSRQELIADVEDLKRKITGTNE